MAGNEPGITGLTGLKVGDGRNYPSSTSMWAIQSSVVTASLTTVNTYGSSSVTATLSGFGVGDFVAVQPVSAMSANVNAYGYMSATDVLTVVLANSGATTVVNAATGFRVLALDLT